MGSSRGGPPSWLDQDSWMEDRKLRRTGAAGCWLVDLRGRPRLRETACGGAACSPAGGTVSPVGGAASPVGRSASPPSASASPASASTSPTSATLFTVDTPLAEDGPVDLERPLDFRWGDKLVLLGKDRRARSPQPEDAVVALLGDRSRRGGDAGRRPGRRGDSGVDSPDGDRRSSRSWKAVAGVKLEIGDEDARPRRLLPPPPLSGGDSARRFLGDGDLGDPGGLVTAPRPPRAAPAHPRDRRALPLPRPRPCRSWGARLHALRSVSWGADGQLQSHFGTSLTKRSSSSWCARTCRVSSRSVLKRSLHCMHKYGATLRCVRMCAKFCAADGEVTEHIKHL